MLTALRCYAKRGLARVVGGFMLAACVLTVVLFINELGFSLVPAPVLEVELPGNSTTWPPAHRRLAVAGGFGAPKGPSNVMIRKS